MINQVMLVGRITKIEEKENEEIKTANITIAVNRSYKNTDGIYETDFISFVLLGNIATNVLEYCQKGDLIGIRGRLRQGVENLNLEASLYVNFSIFLTINLSTFAWVTTNIVLSLFSGTNSSSKKLSTLFSASNILSERGIIFSNFLIGSFNFSEYSLSVL